MILNSLRSFGDSVGDVDRNFMFVSAVMGKCLVSINESPTPYGPEMFLFECYKLGAKDPLETIKYINRRCI